MNPDVIQPGMGGFLAWGKDSGRIMKWKEGQAQKFKIQAAWRKDGEKGGPESNVRTGGCSKQNSNKIPRVDSSKIGIGSVVSRMDNVGPWSARDHGGDRECVRDFAFFEVKDRHPITGDDWRGEKRHSEGYLSALSWRPLRGVGNIAFGQPVRKTGRTTGLAFGVVALADVVTDGKAHKEFVVLPEGIKSGETFMEPGDSGAGGITSDGKAIGILYGDVRNTRVKALRMFQAVDGRRLGGTSKGPSPK